MTFWKRAFGRTGWLKAAGLAIAWGALFAHSSASAQTRRFAVDVRGLSGLSLGGGDGQARMRRTPTFVEAGMHTWFAEETGFILGAALRIEVEDRVSAGGVVRAGLRAVLEPLELRPSIGLAVIVGPFSLVGPEASLIVAVRIGDRFAVLGQILADAYLFGSDLPQGTIVAMFNGGLGVEISL